jgi:phenylalanyl-tRNA synthetase beta chain
MKEWGQPLHAFDLRRVREKIVVRRFAAGEQLRLLDGRVVEGSTDDAPLGICDAHAPMALAGIMGGEGSGITDATSDVLLEAAHFEPTAIRFTSRKLGVSSDSSYRFERGMDPNETLDAARERAMVLLGSVAGAQSMGSLTDVYPVPAKRSVFVMPAKEVSGYLGIKVSATEVLGSLKKLGYKCSDDLKEIEVPTRRVDVNDSVVLIEDVARVIGYERIAPIPSAQTPSAGGTTALDQARQSARALLAGAGLLELRGVPLEPLDGEHRYSQLEGQSITLANPLNADLAQVRRSLVPFLVKTAVYNATRRATTFRYFEIDKIFSRPAREPEEHWSVALLLGGANTDSDWSTRRDVDFFDLKGTVETLLEGLRVPKASFEPGDITGYEKGTVARVVVNGAVVGAMGQVDPVYLRGERITQAVFAAELLLSKLLPYMRATPAFEALPRYPGVFRDLSFLVSTSVSYVSIEQVIRSAAGALLENVSCMDIFSGKGMPEGKRSIAVSMVFRAADRTLSSEEVAAALDEIVSNLKREFGAELRS